MSKGGGAASAKEFVDQAAQYWEEAGLPHASGAILGVLMVCEPASQTQSQIGAALKISTGTVSTQLGLLTRAGLVERVRTIGDRAGRYQLPPNVWTHIMRSEASRIAGLRALADAGLAALPTSRTDRVASLDTMVRFWEAEWPGLETRFEEFVRKDTQ